MATREFDEHERAMDQEPEECPPMCCVCGMPPCVCRLLRLTFVEDGKGRIMEDGFQVLSVAVSKVPKSNDSLVCEDCIRGIKRIPFSDFEQTGVAS